MVKYILSPVDTHIMVVLSLEKFLNGCEKSFRSLSDYDGTSIAK